LNTFLKTIGIIEASKQVIKSSSLKSDVAGDAGEVAEGTATGTADVAGTAAVQSEGRVAVVSFACDTSVDTLDGTVEGEGAADVLAGACADVP
jgi:hypothetical protein